MASTVPHSASSSSMTASSSASSSVPSLRNAASNATSATDLSAHAHPASIHSHSLVNSLPHAHAHVPAHPHMHSQHQLYSPPNSVSSTSAHSPSSTAGESPSSGHYRHSHYNRMHPHYRQQSSHFAYSHPPLHHDQQQPYPYSQPADSSPRSFSRSKTYDQDQYPQQPLSPSSFTQPSPLRHHYQTHTSHSNTYYDHTQSLESTPPPASIVSRENEHHNANNISSNLPEYSYPMTPSQRLHPDHHRLAHRSYHHPNQQEHPEKYRQYFFDQRLNQDQPDRHFVLQSHATQRPPFPRQEPLQHRHDHTRLPPPIKTKLSDDSARECPILSCQSGSSQSMGFRSVDRVSPATPRSVQMHGSILRQSSTDQYPLVESPLDYLDSFNVHHSIASTLRKHYDREDHDMEHCSEQDDVRDREDNEVEDEEDIYMESQRKKQKSGPGNKGTTQVVGNGGKDRAYRGEEQMELGDEHDEERRSSQPSASSSRKQSVAGSLKGDDRPITKSKKTKAASQKRGARVSPVQAAIGEALDRIEDDVQAANGSQPLAGKGLRIYAQRVCERVEAKGSTCYNELAQELSLQLVQELLGANVGGDDAPDVPGQENIRRRVYDALNVLGALDIISFDGKDIKWVGIHESKVIQEVTEATAVFTQDQQPEPEGDDESEEPEDDDMEIEKLQKEVDAMKLRNELQQAQLQDQVTRHVQVLNLVKRNKRRESKEQDREERRRLRKEEKRARAMIVDRDPSMTDVGPHGSSGNNDEPRRKSERHRRRRSPRLSSEKPEGEAMAEETEEDREEDKEEAYQKQKQARKEKRERKEKRARRRQEKEQERIQLPFVCVRVPGYVGQSSDSESSISVVRRVREEQKIRRSGKGKRQNESNGDETTMVEIQIPYQDDLSIISDTEILGDLGFNTVALDDLQAMLPKNLMDTVQYAVNVEDNTHPQLHHNLLATRRSHDVSAPGEDTSMADIDRSSSPANVTVRGGFEREIVRAASEGASPA
ncbi:Transcription factor Dp-2 [Haplosporangium sp. Z 767]|nr:Transcription factor Dp-2 [Haplosporangium sp. Z 11]KAF9194746.1 Transcription factor Dp-2 [Haplosporangium sp. Z 767]